MKKNIQTKTGYALVTAMGVMAVLAIAFTSLHNMGKQSLYQSRLLRDRTKAAAYAEAGIEFAYSILYDNYENRNNSALFRLDTGTEYTDGDSLKSSYGDGSFAIQITQVNSGQYCIVNSIGVCNLAEVEVEALVEDTEWPDPTEEITDYSSLEAFRRGICGGSTGKFGGGGALVAGNPELTIHTNGDIVLGGDIDVLVSINSSTEIDLKKKDVNGSVTAPSVEGNTKGVPETETTVPTIPTPDISFTKYINQAQDNSQVYSGDQTFGNFVIPGGVLYVDGDVQIKGNVVGTIIATGDIKILSGGVKESGWGIAVGTKTGNITDNSVGDSEGLFYSYTGDFTQGASGGTLTGQIIVGGAVDKTGGKSIVFDLSLPNPPGTSESSYEANPVIAAWQK